MSNSSNSIDSLKVLLVIVIGAAIVIIIDEIMGIDFRISPVTSHIIHNLTRMVWGIALWKAFGK